MKPHFYPYHEGAFLVNVCLSQEDGTSQILTFNHTEAPDVNQQLCIREIQAAFDKADRIVGHNLKFDLLWAVRLGLDFGKNKLFCTQVVEYLLNGQAKMEYSLAAVSERRGIPQKLDEVKAFWEAGIETDQIPLAILEPYVERDAQNTLGIYQQQWGEVQKKGLSKLVALQMELLRCLVEIEHNGMAVCCNRMEEFICELGTQVRAKEAAIQEEIGWPCNIASKDELSVALYGGTLTVMEDQAYVTTRNLVIKEPFLYHYKSGMTKIKHRNRTVKELVVKTRKVGVPVYRKGLGFKATKGDKVKKSADQEDRESFYSTAKNTIQMLKATNAKQRRMKALLVEFSNLNKAYQSFLGKGDSGLANKIQPDGCLHPHFNQSIAATGRLTSSDPNGQNFPRKGTSPVKRIFIPRKAGWKITNADLAQLEWRIAAFLSQDPVAIAEIVGDVDYHRDNAIRFFGADPNLPNDHPEFKPLRTVAKVFGFRLLYGGSAYGMYMDQTMPAYSRARWDTIVREYYEKYEVLARWQQENISQVYANDGVLQMVSGRIFHFLEQEQGKKHKYLPTQIKNYPVQGTAADVVALAMVTVRRKMRAAQMQTLMVGQVHDALVFDGPAEEVHQLEQICLETFRDLPRLLGIFWGVDWNVPLDGDVESGDSYGETYPLAA